VLLTSALAGCGEERSVPVVTGTGASGGTGGNGGNAGDGGEGDDGGAGEGGAAADGGNSSGGAPDGAGGAEDGGGGSGIPPIDAACSGDRAFAAVSGAFVDPTPQDFALALNAAILGVVAPMSFVVRTDGDMAEVAASYTIVGDGAHSFLAAMAPDFVPAWIAEGGFGTSSSQNRGYLLVELDDGPLEVPLDNLSFFATTRDGCTRGVVSMTGVLPAENADLVERITGTATDEADAMSEERRTPEEAVTVSALFSVELVEFDFEGLE
jgi:hypothetical protein